LSHFVKKKFVQRGKNLKVIHHAKIFIMKSTTLLFLVHSAVSVMAAPVPNPSFWASMAGATGGVIGGTFLTDWWRRHHPFSPTCYRSQLVCVNGITTIDQCSAMQSGNKFTMGPCQVGAPQSPTLQSNNTQIVFESGTAAAKPLALGETAKTGSENKGQAMAPPTVGQVPNIPTNGGHLVFVPDSPSNVGQQQLPPVQQSQLPVGQNAAAVGTNRIMIPTVNAGPADSMFVTPQLEAIKVKGAGSSEVSSGNVKESLNIT
jgi:hypothetical protein